MKEIANVGSHLNANGAKLYTEKVMEEIIQ